MYVRMTKKEGILTKPLATPVFEDPPPPPTKICLPVNICRVYSGKFTLASRSQLFLLEGILFPIATPGQTFLLSSLSSRQVSIDSQGP